MWWADREQGDSYEAAAAAFASTDSSSDEDDGARLPQIDLITFYAPFCAIPIGFPSL